MGTEISTRFLIILFQVYITSFSASPLQSVLVTSRKRYHSSRFPAVSLQLLMPYSVSSHLSLGLSILQVYIKEVSSLGRLFHCCYQSHPAEPSKCVHINNNNRYEFDGIEVGICGGCWESVVTAEASAGVAQQVTSNRM